MHLSLVSAQNVEIMWLTTYWEYMCMHTGVQTTCVSNTPWGCLWGVTSLRESWNVIWGCGGLAALGIQSRRSLAKGSGVSILGHVSGIRNLDPPDPQRAVKYCWKGRKKKDTTPLKVHTTEECEGKKKEEEGQRERQTGQRLREKEVAEMKRRHVDIRVERECDRRSVWVKERERWIESCLVGLINGWRCERWSDGLWVQTVIALWTSLVWLCHDLWQPRLILPSTLPVCIVGLFHLTLNWRNSPY